MPLRIFALAMAIVVSGPVTAQQILTSPDGAGPILLPDDMTVLEAGEVRRDLDCTVAPDKALLGFDLKFHAGYGLSVPLKELEGRGGMLKILFRVTPKQPGVHPVYFSQQFRVPPLEDTVGSANLGGEFDLGAGSYHVDWLMHNEAGLFCSSYWDVKAALGGRDRNVPVALPAGAIRAAEDEQFQPEAPVARSAEAPLKVKLLMNFAPQREDAPAVDPVDRAAMLSILRNLARNPRIGKFSVVAFNIQQQRVLYRQGPADRIDFPAMGDALNKLQLGTVNLRQLARKNGDSEFLSSLIREEAGRADQPDGLIFIGPKTLLDAGVPQDELKQVGDLDYPVFYMNYARNPMEAPWKDAISRAVKFFRGREYTISAPSDLWNAIVEVVSSIVQSKQARAVPTGGG